MAKNLKVCRSHDEVLVPIIRTVTLEVVLCPLCCLHASLTEWVVKFMFMKQNTMVNLFEMKFLGSTYVSYTCGTNVDLCRLHDLFADVNMVAEPKAHQTGRKRQNIAKTGNDW